MVFWGSLVHVSVREALRSENFPAWEGCRSAGRMWRWWVEVPRLPVDARTSTYLSLTRPTRCAGVPSGLCAPVRCSVVRVLQIFMWSSHKAISLEFRPCCERAELQWYLDCLVFPPSSLRAVYSAPSPSLSVARWMAVGRMSRCIYAAGDLALISLRVSLLLHLSSRGLYQHELDTSMHHPRDCGVLLAAPCHPGAVRRRQDVAVPCRSCDDYFFDFSFIAVIFFWDVFRIRPIVLITPSLIAALCAK
ncbi:hypothetical protein K438DRAFT_300264 [Mycena galopus ATCC 62051]|nr:hypothetical protein K438DRAFT_300264 [Mycena galopus ATCC 62051]